MRKLLALLVLVIPLAFAQKIVVSPEAIVVNPAPAPGFNVSVSLDKGGTEPVYQVGEGVRISVRVSETSYVYLFSVKPDGEITQILPNRYDQQGQNNLLQAGEARTFPPQGARYTFTVAPPLGLSKVIAVASKRRLDTSQIARFTNGSGFASGTGGQDGFVHGFAIIVQPVPQQDWVTDTVQYYVGNPPQQTGSATLRIDSSPQGARAYVDGAFVGTTPVVFRARPGNHDVKLTLANYGTFETTVNARPGQTQAVRAQLRPVARTGTVSFDSSPRGARVLLDGHLVGTTPTGRVTVDAGSHSVRFSLEGYQDSTVPFQLYAGSDRVVAATLQRAVGNLVIQANVGSALVFVDGRNVGTIPNGSGRLTLPDLQPGLYELTLIAPGYRTYVTSFTIQAGQTTPVTATMLHL